MANSTEESPSKWRALHEKDAEAQIENSSRATRSTGLDTSGGLGHSLGGHASESVWEKTQNGVSYNFLSKLGKVKFNLAQLDSINAWKNNKK